MATRLPSARRRFLEEVDAPETDQVCLNANGVRWTCGERVQRPTESELFSRAVAEGSKTTPDGDNAK